MKKYIIIVLFFLTLFNKDIFSQDRNVKLIEIVKNKQVYKNREISLVLKLKNIDYNFFKIYFYDENNHDVGFNFDIKDLKGKLKKYFSNIHEGENYRVNFRITSIDDNDIIHGDLISFKAILLEKIVK